jgi:hypothetical protein
VSYLLGSALRFLRKHRKGIVEARWAVLDFTPDDYDKLWSILVLKPLKDYFVDKVRYVNLCFLPYPLPLVHSRGVHRYDWSLHDYALAVRMPTSVHGIFTEMVVEEIKSQLNSAQHERCGSIAAVLSQIRSETTSDVYLYSLKAVNGRFPKRSPLMEIL